MTQEVQAMLSLPALFAHRRRTPPRAATSGQSERAALCRHATLAAVECQVAALEAALVAGDAAARTHLAVALAVRQRLQGA